MKVMAKPVEVIAWFTEDGEIRPLRFRFTQEQEEVVVSVGKIYSCTLSYLGGMKNLVYECESEIYGRNRRYQLQYHTLEPGWILYKIDS